MSHFKTPSHAVAITSTVNAPLSHARNTWMSVWLLLMAGFVALLIVGCSEERPQSFEPNLVHAMKYQIKEGIDMEQASDDAFWIVTQMFGTPDQPKLPEVVTEDEELKSLVSLDNLIKASGHINEEGRGLYQKHCLICHGLTGDGRGTSSSILNPYPRDYRKGIFKFKTTRRGAKPTREDLAEMIRNGIPGSAMVAIPALKTDDAAVEALTDYVIYLSWRGELERSLLDDAVFELDLEGGDRLINPAHLHSGNEEEKEVYEESWEIAEDYAAEIAEAWLEAPDDIVEVPDPPAEIPVANNYEEFVAFSKSDKADALAKSVARGEELFKGKIASCSKCHGEKGRGDGQTTDYDEWTKEWTLGIGIKPENRDALIPLLARGAMPPINAKPRNFATGAFHGGGSAKRLYLRITQGIEGTPMPAVTFVDGQFEKEDVWNLINFIRSLQDPPSDEPSPTTPDAATKTPQQA